MRAMRFLALGMGITQVAFAYLFWLTEVRNFEETVVAILAGIALLVISVALRER